MQSRIVIIAIGLALLALLWGGAAHIEQMIVAHEHAEIRALGGAADADGGHPLQGYLPANDIIVGISVFTLFIGGLLLGLMLLYLRYSSLLERLRRANAAMRRSEARFTSAQQFARIGTWEWDIPSGGLLWLGGISQMLGYPPGMTKVSYDNFIDRVHPEDRERVTDAINACLQGGREYEVEHRVVWPDGTVRWLLERGDAVRDDTGEPQRMLGVVQDITARRNMEDSLRKSERLLTQAQALARVGNWSLDVASGELYWSEEIYRIFGRQPDEFQPSYERFFEAVHPDDVDDIKASEERAFSQAGKHSLDHRIVLPGGEVRWVHEEGEVIPGANGEPLVLQGTVHDITERKRAEIDLQKNASLMALITDTQSQYLYGEDPREVFKALLNGMLALTESEYGFIGERRHSEAGDPYLKSFAISDISWDEQTAAFYRQYEEQGLEFRNLDTLFGYTIKSGDPVISNDPQQDHRSAGLPPGHPAMSNYLGLPFYFGHTMVGMIGLANRPEGYDESVIEFLTPVLNACAYIFERMATEASLRESETKFRTLVESTMDAVLLFSGEGFVDGNPAALNMFGIEDKEALTKLHPLDLSPHTQTAGESSKQLCEAHIKTAYERGGHRFEWVHKRANGEEFDAEVSLTSIQIGGKPLLQAIVRDISQRRKAERDKDELYKQLLQSQKMESLGHLTGGIAHDFNNILTSIIGFSGLGREVAESSELSEMQEYMHEVHEAGMRAKELIGQMLAFSRGDHRGEFQPVDIQAMVKEVVKMLRPVLPSSIAIRSLLDEAIPAVMGDETQIHQVLMNLCINARDAMAGTGVIEVELKKLSDLRTFCASCHKAVNGTFVQLNVRDTGPGIEDDALGRLFEPFYTTKAQGEGSGMGLSVVHGIVHGHGGHIAVTTAPGQGTEFQILLPVALATEWAPAPAEQEISVLRGSGEHVLVVDDEEAVGKFLETLLIKNNYRVSRFSDSITALSHFSENPAQFDMVITDQTMPGMTGTQLAGVMLALRPALPVVLCSGYSEHQARGQMEAMGIRSVLPKPIDVRDLLTTLAGLAGC